MLLQKSFAVRSDLIGKAAVFSPQLRQMKIIKFLPHRSRQFLVRAQKVEKGKINSANFALTCNFIQYSLLPLANFYGLCIKASGDAFLNNFPLSQVFTDAPRPGSFDIHNVYRIHKFFFEVRWNITPRSGPRIFARSQTIRKHCHKHGAGHIFFFFLNFISESKCIVAPI